MVLYTSIANLQLLPSTDNIEKSNHNFGEWLLSRTPDFSTTHFIPTGPTLYNAESFLEFIRHREELLRKQYLTILGFGPEPTPDHAHDTEDKPEKKPQAPTDAFQ